MKKILVFSLLWLVVFSCSKECWETVGDDIVETRQIDAFDHLLINDNFTIHLIQDSLSFVELRGKSNLISNVETSVENNTLTISDKNTCGLTKGYHQNEIYIHCKNIEEIKIPGSANIYSEDTLFFEQLFIEVVGDLVKWDFKIKSDKLRIELHSVVGEMKIQGQVERVALYTTGRNHCFFKDLKCNIANVNHTCLGDYYLTVEKEIYITLNGSGDFYCYGTPETRNVKKAKNATGEIFYFDE